MNFKADPATDEQLEYYGDWYADFVLTVNKDIILDANLGEGAGGYLSGQYDAWSENWVDVPFNETVELKANEELKIMEYAAASMNQSGLQVTYNDVYTSVQDFDCGVFFTEDFIKANPDLEATLALKIYNPENPSENYVIGETYVFVLGAVAENVQTGVVYNDVNLATLEAEEGQTVKLLRNVNAGRQFAVYSGVTFDLNGKKLEAEYVTSFGNIIDSSEENSGLLVVAKNKLMLQHDNEQLPIKTADGFVFVEIIKFNQAFVEKDNKGNYVGKYAFQPIFEPFAHELIVKGRAETDVTIVVEVAWKNDSGDVITQNFVYNDEFVKGYVNSYVESTGKYGQMFTLVLNNVPAGLSFRSGVAFGEIDREAVEIKAEQSVDYIYPVIEQTQTTTINAEADKASALVAEGTKLNGTELALKVTELDESNANVTVSEGESVKSVDVHIDGIAENNTVPAIITVKELAEAGLNQGNLKLYHVENGTANEMIQVFSLDEVDAHNEFYYDPATGDITMALATFSEIVTRSNVAKVWEGKFDYNWYDASKTELTIANADQLAAFGAIVGGMAEGIAQDSFSGKTVKLLADINLGYDENNESNIIFYPIGYNSSDGTYKKTGVAVTTGFYNFCGTFDGNGHTIANFYQNTWEMKGDNTYYDLTLQYYRDGMGLFGRVYGGTVKNLTVSNFSSDGEYTTTGAIAAYADGATFENIAITDCNPRVYNIGNGGIVGCVGWYAREAGLTTTFKNITVDNSNKISALWGSYDVACGGIVGQYYPTSGQTYYGKPANGGISFENCHISAQMDVYNDVCANYQYYAYRYTGMLIGSVRENETKDGHVYPKMDGITAKDCTVHFGTWNDYYYCEFEKNGHPSYAGQNDYKFSRIPHSELNFTDSNGNGIIDTDEERASVTGCKHEHTAAENNQAIRLPFNNLVTGYGWGVTTKVVGELAGVTILDREVGDSVEKFETKFKGDFLYRVGNENAVALGSLFEAKEGATISNSGVVVSIDKLDEKMNVSGTYTANTSDWTKGTIKFEGTGVVKVTIQDYNFCKPTELLLEVVDAKNITKAESATANNVVLLNDISGTFVVSGGHTFYGNGFTVKLPTTSVKNIGNGFTGYISLGGTEGDGNANGGNLDNVRIEGPVYPEMYIYRDQAKITDENDPEYGDGYNMRYFVNSVLVYGGNCTISNCYISGSRTALCLRGGNNVVIENTTLSGGAYANMQICAGSNVTLRDLTTIQVDVTDSYGKGKTAHGLGIAVDSDVVDIYIEGELNQYNWLNETIWDKQVPSAYQSSFPDFFGNSKYQSYWHYLGGDKYVNLTFIFACNWNTEKIHDNREVVDYATCDSTISGVAGGVYSKVNTIGGNSITDSDVIDPGYTSPGFNPVAPKLNFDNSPNNDEDDVNDAIDTYCVYNEGNGTLKLGLTGTSKTLDLSKVSVTKDGVALNYTAYLNGTKINGNSVTIKAADGAKQTLTFKATSNDAGYDKDGNPIAGSIEYTWNVTIEVATLSFPAPEWNMGGDYEFDKTNLYYAYYKTSQGYGEAVPIYEEIKIKYYDKTGKLVERDLSGTTTHPTGSNNSNSNAFTYTLSDGSTLTMKFSSGWKSGATTHQFTTYGNKVYIYPQSLDNDNYVRAKTTNQDFDVKITYNFTDPNGQSTGDQTMRWYNAKASNGSVSTVQWKTFDSTNGKECITPDTLITLADGSQVRVDSLKGNEELLVWNIETGALDTAQILFVDSEHRKEYEIVHLYFSDGTDVKVIGEHGFWDYDLNKYVYLDANADEYIGHSFAKQNGEKLEKVELVDVVIETEVTEAWSPVTAGHLCYFVNGMLSMPGGVGGLFNIFEVDPETMMYDFEAMEKDIEKYGLFTYEEMNEIAPLSKEMFEKAGGAYLKVSIGKGNMTIDELKYMINRYNKFFE